MHTPLRKPVIAVFGGGRVAVPTDSSAYKNAVTLGRLIADAEAVLLCGGGGGVMEAAAMGVRDAGGRSIAIMPTLNAAQGRANPYIDLAIYTGLRDGRNFLNAALPDAAIAMQGEAGTLSEIGLALKLGTPLVYLGAWDFLNHNGLPSTPHVERPDEALDAVFAALGIAPRERLASPMKQPLMPDQATNLAQLSNAIQAWS